MLEAFWSGVGEELAQTWVARVLTPAFAFWVGGLALLWWHTHTAEVAAHGWAAALAAPAAVLGALPVLVQGALVVGGLVLVAASAVIAERLTLPVLRLLEGYWTRPAWLHRLLVGYRRWRYRRVRDRAAPLQLRQHRRLHTPPTPAEYKELMQLRNKPKRARSTTEWERLQHLEGRAELTATERARLGRDVAWLLTTPADDDLRMPTRFGDILRAAEHRPGASYGLDAVVCWNALRLLLPAESRTELTAARSGLDATVRGWLWGALFLVWTPVNPWAALVGVGVPLLSYRFGILPRAVAFGELIVTSYDLHRMELYDALHLPGPTTPADERATAGPRVTRALSGTLVEPHLAYRFDPPRTAQEKPKKRVPWFWSSR